VTSQPRPDGEDLGPAFRRALELGRRVAGTTAPNPAVGCVILAAGTIVGEGATAPAGGPHAEVLALQQAGDRARGGVAVITLEPCAHHGRTPPCVDALIDAGLAEVHFLVSDPNEVAAGGSARLRAAGIRVGSAGPEHQAAVVQARHDLRGFFASVTTGRPHVTLKLALRADGSTVPGRGERYLTGAVARERVHALRAEVDAVLVGGATIRADDPGLDVRHVVATRQPRPVVLSGDGRIPPTAAVLARHALLLVGPGVPASQEAMLRAAGATLIRCPTAGVGTDTSAAGQMRLDLRAAMQLLLAAGIMTVLAEPGLSLARALAADDLVDVVELHIVGPISGAPVVPLGLAPERFEPAEQVMAGDDLVLRALRRPRTADVRIRAEVA
jgi:diaminohydroxyphosphoribosylaminopyrimidine deaminase / 5-amino-6-(5-phosphoribosylamino)uracil reductase